MKFHYRSEKILLLGVFFLHMVYKSVMRGVRKGCFYHRWCFSVGDGRQGHTDEAPYNAIHVGAAAPTLPQALVEQLAPGGRLIIPIGPEGANQNLEQVRWNFD